MKIGFIGMGNMGFAILKGLVNSVSKKDIIFTDINTDRCEYVKEQTGVNYVTSNIECANNSDYIVLAVKPQFLPSVMEELKGHVDGKVIISIVVSITIDTIKKALGDVKVVRSMPNTPAMVGEGMTGVSYDESIFAQDEIQIIDMFFNAFGRYEKVDEKLLDIVTCASGSSPAYMYMFIEALADSVVKYGMPRDKAYTFVAQTMLGSAKFVLESGMHPAALKDMVCSPGGTTIAGVAALEDAGFRNAIMKATDACYRRSEELR